MKRTAVALVVGSLVLGGMTVPAAAGGWHRGHHGYDGGPGYFLGGFLAGATTVLVLDALRTPRVVYGPPAVYYGPPVVYGPPVGYAPPVVYGPVYTRVPVCRNVWIPERYEQQAREQNGFTTYYQVRVPGYWQQQCY